ncbi:type II secretion system protein GspM [Sideroxydans sp.]
MKARIERLKAAHWDSLSAAEQKTIRRGAGLLLPLLAYGLLWQPAHDALPKLQDSLPSVRAQAAQMAMQASEVQELRQRAELAVLDRDALKSAVERSAEGSGLSLIVTPGEQNSVHISADAISFERWLQWLHTIGHTQHIRVSTAILAASPVPGMIKMQATLSNGADQ